MLEIILYAILFIGLLALFTFLVVYVFGIVTTPLIAFVQLFNAKAKGDFKKNLLIFCMFALMVGCFWFIILLDSKP